LAFRCAMERIPWNAIASRIFVIADGRTGKNWPDFLDVRE
jgi:hypothetical protein